MVRFIVELISNCSVVVKTSDCQQNSLRRIYNGVPQGSVLSPLLFKTTKEYGYTDELALLKIVLDWNNIEETLSQVMSTLATWLKQWRLKLSVVKTVSTAFHLSNWDVKRELNQCQRQTMQLPVSTNLSRSKAR